MTQFKWTPDILARAIEMRHQAKSASVIAAEIGTTRNAVCGMFGRMGVKAPIAPKPPPPEPVNVVVLFDEPEEPEPESNVVVLTVRRIALLDLKANQCRFPIDREDGGFDYCGKPKASITSSYCPACHSICYVAPRTKLPVRPIR
jgi:hypothetical protein